VSSAISIIIGMADEAAACLRAAANFGDEEQPITAMPLFGTFGLYSYANGNIVGTDSMSGAVLMREDELPCRQKIFDLAHRELASVPQLTLDAAEGRCAATLSGFAEKHVKGFLPAHIRGLANDWPAVSKWNFDFFSNEFGTVEVQVTMPSGKKKPMQLAEYLAEVQSEGPDQQPRARDRAQPYLRGWYYERDLPALSQDLWGIGDFHEVAFKDWFKRLPKRHHPDLHWIFLGGAGASTPMHVDPTTTHAWLTQIHGRKRFVLFAPCDIPALLRDPDKGGSLISPEEAEARGVKGHEVLLEPGDTLFVPAFWPHYVECIDDSISVTWNYLGEQLFPVVRAAYMAHQMGSNVRAAVAAEKAEISKDSTDAPAHGESACKDVSGYSSAVQPTMGPASASEGKTTDAESDN
jgi:mannose-6-phosphate isomerase-like protein (cupin superfamily)